MNVLSIWYEFPDPAQSNHADRTDPESLPLANRKFGRFWLAELIFEKIHTKYTQNPPLSNASDWLEIGWKNHSKTGNFKQIDNTYVRII